MVRVGLLSDTHNSIHPGTEDFFRDCNEIWHAGDIGNRATADRLAGFKPLKAVYGNIDGQDIRIIYPEFLVFTSDQLKVAMLHRSGYPGRYTREAVELIGREKPDILVGGHSHILRIIYDKKHELLHLNPGAAGQYGFHKVITLLRFTIDGKEIRDMEIGEFEK